LGDIQKRGGEEPAALAASVNSTQREKAGPSATPTPENASLLDDCLQVLLSSDSESEFTGVATAIFKKERCVPSCGQPPTVRGRAAKRGREQQHFP
jgi:hypothetical protein